MKYEKGKLTQAILETVIGRAISPTATEVAHALDHSPAIVSGILARLHHQGRVCRGNVQRVDGAGPWRYAGCSAKLTDAGFVPQAPEERS